MTNDEQDYVKVQVKAIVAASVEAVGAMMPSAPTEEHKERYQQALDHVRATSIEALDNIDGMKTIITLS